MTFINGGSVQNTAIYFLIQNKIVLGGLFYALAINTKLSFLTFFIISIYLIVYFEDSHSFIRVRIFFEIFFRNLRSSSIGSFCYEKISFVFSSFCTVLFFASKYWGQK